MTARVPLLALALALVPAVALAQAPPAPEVTGVPLYPGAHYEAQASEGMSQPSEKYYIFTTADSLPQVVAFFEHATRKKGEALAGAVIIAIEGKSPFPSHGVLVERNRPGMYPAPVRTIYTVRRAPSSPEE
jgi:hypothetical protein